MPENCDNCHFARWIDSKDAVACHRYPPTITGAMGNQVTVYFPLVSKQTWCGEWRANGGVKDVLVESFNRGMKPSTKSNRRKSQ